MILRAIQLEVSLQQVDENNYIVVMVKIK